MTVKVFIAPSLDQVKDDNGVGQVIHAQYRYLPQFDVELVSHPDMAEVIACHIQQGDLPRVDVLHCHGLYWTGDKGSGQYQRWHQDANMYILDAARKAYAITVPSEWVAEPFKRDMRIVPEVIGHGIDLKQWPKQTDHKGYLLWNKNRLDDVCDPSPAYALAERGINVFSTLKPRLVPARENFTVTGVVPHDQMVELIQHAEIYLATTKETFGIGTLEALAAGVPVLGYRWGGTADLVEHKKSGYLVDPGDIDGLMEGCTWLQAHRATISKGARARARRFTWKNVTLQYAALYHRIAEEKRTERHGVSVIITNHNYGHYVAEAIESCLAQTYVPDEIIIVDDGSTDDSQSLILDYAERYPERIHALIQENSGVAAARNTGIAKATQPYLICLDADDKLHPEYIRACRDALEHDRGLGVVYTGLGLLQQDGNISPNQWPPPFTWESQATPANPPSNCIPCAAMFRRSMWERAGGYKQVYAPGEDTEFFTRGLSVGFQARKITDEFLFHYRMHGGSASRTKEYKPIDTLHPWMRDKRYPMAAPAAHQPRVQSYSSPAVSIVIPVGPGHDRFLGSALESIVGQTNRSWEVIVVDDTDPAENQGYWNQIKRQYPFIHYHATEGRQGPAISRNLGVTMARAPLTLFLDADDSLLPETLQTMLEAYHASGGRYVYSDFVTLYGEQVTYESAPEYEQRAWLEKGQHAITALIPTEDIRGVGGFDPTLPGWEDWDFFIKLALSGVCGVRVPQALLVYRQHTGTIREQSLENKDAILDLFRERYGAFVKGESSMPGCCGGNGGALLAAKRAIAEANGEIATNEAITMIPPTMPEPRIRMEFTGDQRGAIAYIAQKSREVYRGGNNPNDKYINALPEDVPYLESLGVWRVVHHSIQTVEVFQ